MVSGYGQPLPVVTAVDSIPLALGCAARCLTAEEWVATVDSVLNSTDWTIPPDIQAEMGRVARAVMAMFGRCDARSQSGTESIARLRLIAAGFEVEVQPGIGTHEHADLRIGALLIECDGRAYHSDVETFRNDRRRDRMTMIDRWLTMRLTYDDVLYNWDGGTRGCSGRHPKRPAPHQAGQRPSPSGKRVHLSATEGAICPWIALRWTIFRPIHPPRQTRTETVLDSWDCCLRPHDPGQQEEA